MLLMQTHAAVVQDIASNYTSFVNASNGGFGFQPWAISSNGNGGPIFAGSVLGDSTIGAGNINTSGVSFSLFAHPTAASVDASRAFTTALLPGQVFSFKLALNSDNGNKGFNLFAGSQGELFNFNIGSGGSVSSANAVLNPGSGAGYNYGGNDAVINVAISVLSPSSLSYQISRTSSLGNQGNLFTGTITGLTDAVSSFSYYVSGTDNGAAQNTLYINNLQVVPEPAAGLLVAMGGISCVFRRRVGR